MINKSNKHKLGLKTGIALVLTASQLIGAGGITAFASSPEFARSSEEWAMLRDNKLEWNETAALVNEYNATVLTNRHNFSKDERKLMDAEEMKGYLNDQADNYESMAAAAEETNAVLAAQLRAQASSSREQAEENVTDSEIIRLGYNETEAGILNNVKNLMIDYYELLDKNEVMKSKIEYLERQYKSAENMFNVGMATKIDVLNAKEALDNGRASIITMEASIAQTYKNLIVLCGWKYDAQAEIGALPKPNIDRSAGINYEEDLNKALENSYTLKADRKKLDNAKNSGFNSELTEKKEKKLKDDTDSIKLQVKSSYDALISAETAYHNAVSAADIKKGQLLKAETEFSLGTISQMDILKAQQDSMDAEAAVRTAERDLLKAEVKYDTAIAGYTQSAV